MLAEAIIDLHIFFDRDMDKVAAWLNAYNKNFGGANPISLIKRGKISSLHKFVMKEMRQEPEAFELASEKSLEKSVSLLKPKTVIMSFE